MRLRLIALGQGAALRSVRGTGHDNPARLSGHGRTPGRGVVVLTATRVAVSAALVMAAVLAASSGPAVAATDYTVYVANFNNTVTPIDAATNTGGTPIQVGLRPWGIGATPNGQTVYVTNEGDDTVTPIDTATNTTGTPIRVGDEPDAIVVSPDGQTGYCLNSASDSVTPFSVATGTPGAAIPAGSMPSGLAITPDGRTLYVSDFGNHTLVSMVTTISTAAGTAGPTVSLPVGLSAVAITPDGATAYVLNSDSDTLTPISTATNSARTPIALPDTPSITTEPGSTIPLETIRNDYSAMVLTPDGSTAYVADELANTVTAVNLATGAAGTPISIGPAFNPGDSVEGADALAITPDGKTLYVASAAAGTVTPIDLASGSLGTPIPVGPQPSALVIVPRTPSTQPPSTSTSSTGSSATSTSSTAANASAGASAVVVTRAPSPVSLASARPALSLSLRLSKAASLTLRLVNAHGGTLATWSRRLSRGADRLELALPAAARHRGTDTLRISAPGSATNAIRIVVR